jgi:hypothetical protein
MEVPQENSLCSYLKQAKMSFLFSFFCKIREQEGGTGSACRVDISGRGGEGRWGKGIFFYRVNMVQKLYTKWRKVSPEMGRDKGK